MDLLNRILRHIEALQREQATVRELRRRDDRLLADIGIERADIRRVARRAARGAPSASGMGDPVAATLRLLGATPGPLAAPAAEPSGG
jgi:uncharacterized protein YjiS (DUF1127 family)